MQKLKIFKLLLIGIFALTMGSCDSTDPDSSLTSFSEYPVVITTPAVVAPEGDEETYTFNFTLNGEKQVNPITLEIEVGSSSTATEGVDFELSTHSIDLDAFEGQDGFSVDIHILQDGEVEAEDETIYLTFTQATPSGVKKEEILVTTIEDSGKAGINVSVSWDADLQYKGKTWHLCDSVDLDLYIYDSKGKEITGSAGATSACPEVMWAVFPGDGIYEIWVNFFDRAAFENAKCKDELGEEYSCLGPFDVPLNITFTRGDANQTISYPVITRTDTDVWNYVDGVETNAYVEHLVARVEVVGGTITLQDLNGKDSGSMRKGNGQGRRK